MYLRKLRSGCICCTWQVLWDRNIHPKGRIEKEREKVRESCCWEVLNESSFNITCHCVESTCPLFKMNYTPNLTKSQNGKCVFQPFVLLLHHMVLISAKYTSAADRSLHSPSSKQKLLHLIWRVYSLFHWFKDSGLLICIYISNHKSWFLVFLLPSSLDSLEEQE